MYIFLFPTFPFHPFFLTLSEFTGFHFAWLLCQYLSHNTGSVQECRKMDTLIDNLLQRGTTCSVSKTTCFCNKTSREVYLEIGTNANMHLLLFAWKSCIGRQPSWLAEILPLPLPRSLQVGQGSGLGGARLGGSCSCSWSWILYLLTEG